MNKDKKLRNKNQSSTIMPLWLAHNSTPCVEEKQITHLQEKNCIACCYTLSDRKNASNITTAFLVMSFWISHEMKTDVNGFKLLSQDSADIIYHCKWTQSVDCVVQLDPNVGWRE